ncbi:MAG TPA: hypothetical protein VKH46_10180 [Thermoanaerobaculia bacterium]|jgi:hypothetical protein|nr:hypothetical protein [Thermoanaerobaculia bacterium]
MKRRELENALLILETTPFVYEKVVLGGDGALRRKIAGLLWEAVAIEEHVWTARVRLLRGDAPAVLPRLDRGIARRIASGKSGARDAVAAFLRLRRENARVLRCLRSADARLGGPVEAGGWFSLTDLPAAMAQEDQASLRELARCISAPAAAESREPAPLLVCC